MKGCRFRAELLTPADFLAVFTHMQPVSRTAFKYLGSREQCTQLKGKKGKFAGRSSEQNVTVVQYCLEAKMAELTPY